MTYASLTERISASVSASVSRHLKYRMSVYPDTSMHTRLFEGNDHFSFLFLFVVFVWFVVVVVVCVHACVRAYMRVCMCVSVVCFSFSYVVVICMHKEIPTLRLRRSRHTHPYINLHNDSSSLLIMPIMLHTSSVTNRNVGHEVCAGFCASAFQLKGQSGDTNLDDGSAAVAVIQNSLAGVSLVGSTRVTVKQVPV